MMKKRVLLLAPSFMNIYKDIISGLLEHNMEVVWIQDGQVAGNPYNKRNINRTTKTVEEYDKLVNSLWDKDFNKMSPNGTFDYFLAIDGLMVSNYFFEELRNRNPKIKTRLFLYDRIENNYELDVFFRFYDDIYTFEKSDSVKYHIHHLPIYWTPTSPDEDELYDIFGMATYKAGKRFEIFSKIKELSEKEGLRTNISLYHSRIDNPWLYETKYIINKMMGKKMLSLTQLRDNNIFTSSIMTPDVFRTNICKSKVILDTHNSFQDGLTARFMWALGAEKKIITTNSNILDYPFYDSEQIYVIKDNLDDIIDFVKAPFRMKDSVKNQIVNYRIDNWISTIIGE